MKRIIYIVLTAVVLTLVPATYACAQWEYKSTGHEGMYYVRDAKGKYGFVNERGKLVIPCKWKFSKVFMSGLAKVMDASTDKWGVIDKTGKVLVPCKWKKILIDPFSGDIKAMDDAGKWSNLDRTGKIVE